MPAEDGIYIDHGQALTFTEEMQAQTQKIAGIISDLQGELASIISTWLGPDREVYYTKVQPTWNAEVNALSTILANHATTLDGISDNYRQTVNRNAQGFEEIRF
ncbi:WXG100 family type VII secretion target [Streptomyces sp. J2-1]|uniref:WXG100 family type VII secretion target n=1 Tax=Streptomyces corallincola TaxID=2851888 RepID=UPI001C390445|nr:WXG100 family type VII secretion target [Streptomyces corallincola]MBV2354906.1 WXG100 family type VII secretion target [Streptomyces corallincola]